MVDAQGKRFANELATRAVLTEAVFESGTAFGGDEGGDEKTDGVAPIVAFLLMNQEAADAFGTGVLGFYMGERYSIQNPIVVTCVQVDGGRTSLW